MAQRNNNRIYGSTSNRRPSLETSSANSDEISDIPDERFLIADRSFFKGKSKTSILSTLIGVCVTCCMCIVTIVIAIILIIILIFGYIGYKKAFYVPENVCFGKGSNSPLYFNITTGCKEYDSIPLKQWEPYFRNESQITKVQINSLDLPGKIISGYFYDGTKSEVPFNGKAVLMIHGIRVCKETVAILIPAAMLHRQGYHVLTIDLRNHGESFRNNSGFVTFGSLEHLDAISSLEWLKNKTGLGSDSIGLFGSSMGASTGLITWARDRSIPAFFADSPPCDVAKTLEHNTIGVLPLLPGNILFWMMCQGAPLHTNYGCPPWPFDPLESSKLNLTIGALDNQGNPIGNKLAFKRSIFFEHTEKDPIVPRDITQLCIDEVKKTATFVDWHIGQDNSTDPPIHPAGQKIKCDHHVRTSITETKDYEQRLVSFFENNLKNFTENL